MPSRVSAALYSAPQVCSPELSSFAFLGLYLAAEPGVYFSGIRRATPRRYRATLDACAASAVRILRWWLLSQMLSMAAVGIIVTLGLWILGVPLAGTLGIIAALMTFIPNMGPILSVVPAALLAFAISPVKGLLTVALFILVHFLEGNILTPLLERQIVRLPPALTLTAQLLLAVIAGPLGLALAAPLTAAALGIFQVLLPADSIPSAPVLLRSLAPNEAICVPFALQNHKGFLDHISARSHFPVPWATRLCGVIRMNGQYAKMGSEILSQHPEHFHATRCSTPTVYGVRPGLNTPTVMSLYATDSVILGKCNEVSNKFLLALSITLPCGFPAVDLRRSSTIMGCLTGRATAFNAVTLSGSMDRTAP